MRWVLLFTILFSVQGHAGVFKNTDSYIKQRYLRYIAEVHRGKVNWLKEAQNSKKKYPDKKDQELINDFIKHYKKYPPKIRVIYNDRFVEISVRGHHIGKISEMDFFAGTMKLNGAEVNLDQDSLAKVVSDMENAVKTKTAWHPLHLFIPRAEAFSVAAAQLLAVAFFQGKMMARANQAGGTNLEICPDKGGKPANILHMPYRQMQQYRQALTDFYNHSQIQSASECGARIRGDGLGKGYQMNMNHKVQACKFGLKVRAHCGGQTSTVDETETDDGQATTTTTTSTPSTDTGTPTTIEVTTDETLQDQGIVPVAPVPETTAD